MYGRSKKIGIFLWRGKYIIVHFRGRFQRGRNIFDLEIARDNEPFKILFPQTKYNILTFMSLCDRILWMCLR